MVKIDPEKNTVEIDPKEDTVEIAPEKYADLPESELRAVSNSDTSKLIATVLDVEHTIKETSPETKVENIAVLFAGDANEIRTVLEAYSISTMYLLDLDIDTQKVNTLKNISKNQELEIIPLEGDAFKTITRIPDSTQDMVTAYGVEFLFEMSISATQLAREANISLLELLTYHRTILIEQIYRILRPGGIVFFTVSRDLEKLFDNHDGFERIIGSVFKKK